ncbi:MAG TPA: TonB-dependent receptor [Candidatus Deferrimicrobium sp.]|nr:TonB-dependent receptor [Candidatus Deferrimicrobium sp.]
MRRIASFLTLFVLSCVPAAALELTGIVVDAQRQPLARVSVVTDVSGIGTMTGDDGVYSLRFDDEISRVTFSSVGFRSRQFNLIDLPDSVILERIYYRGEKVVVTADRAESGVTPVAFDNLSRDEIDRDYLVGEFPLLLESTPNLYTYADAGSSLGYTSVKIRGFDDKQIATYINGVPLNDPEEQATYFVDLPDFAANITDIQVQRGVGNSLYGDASFGGSINIVTTGLNRNRKTTLSAGYGSYTSGGKSVSDIYKQSVEYSSGLIDGRWLFSGRFSKQKTGGYRYNSWYEGWAYYYSVARLDPRMTTELHLYGGPMRMHLAYYGTGRDDLAKDRRTNYLVYDNETDNFNQPHYQLHHTFKLSDRATLQNTLYYVRGKGYYEQFKDDRKYFEYNLSVLSDSAGGDLVRQKWVTKNQYGFNPRFTLEHDKGSHTLGGSFYYFNSDHWGQVVSAQYLDGPINPSHRYYTHFGTKYVGSLYGQEFLKVTDKLSAQLTAQVRYEHYRLDQERIGAFKGYDYEVDWLFFSPRAGLNFNATDKASLYFNLAVSSRTPTDAALYDADDPWALPRLTIADTIVSAGDTLYRFGEPTIEPERLYDFELGGRYQSSTYDFGLNFYWMEFHNEIVPDGKLDESGLEGALNVDRASHTGAELSGDVRPLSQFSLSASVSYNHNRIRKFVSNVGRLEINFKDKRVVRFPDYLATFTADYAYYSFRATWHARFVGRQYMELYNIDSLSIDPYFVSSVSLSYTLKDFLDIGNVIVSAKVDNLFDTKYEASGYGGNYAYMVSGRLVVDGWAEYFPAAERSFFMQLKLDLF